MVPRFLHRLFHPSSIVGRIRIAACVSIVLIVLAASATMWGLGNLRETITKLVDVDEPLTASAYEMEINVIGRTLGITNYLDTGDLQHRARVDKDRADYAAFRRQFGSLSDVTATRALLPALDRTYGEFDRLGLDLVAARDELDQLRASGSRLAQVDALGGDVTRGHARLLALRDTLDALLDDSIQRSVGFELQRAKSRTSSTASWMIGYGIALVVAFMGVFLMTGALVVRAVHRPLERLARGMGAIRDDDLDCPLEVANADEFVPVVTQFNEMRTQLRASRARLRGLSSRLESLQEDERARIAREIHDDLGQRLMVIRLAIERIRNPRDIDPAIAAASREELLGLLDDSTSALRRIISELRPAVLDRLGLPSALEWLADDFERRSGIPCVVEIEGEGDIPAACATPLFRALQEALANIVRHAAAQSAAVRLIYSAGRIQMTIEDDGIGVRAGALDEPGRFGVLGMRERVLALGGRLRVAARPSGGTLIEIEVPAV